MEVCPFDRVQDVLGYSNQARYIYKYAKDINANTVVIEDHYIDKDYLIDYSKFYARSFDTPPTVTKRLHFFSENFSTENFREMLVNCDKEQLNALKESYLGFVVVKPIRDTNENPLIGRTLLKPYHSDIEQEYRCFLSKRYPVSLYGIPLNINSLAFQVQDIAVGACATAALWTSLHPSRDLFGIPSHSPAEITEISVSFPSDSRNFPSRGLTLLQMINYIHSLEMETEIIDVQLMARDNPKINDCIVPDAVKSYIKVHLPLIAMLKLKNNKNVDAYHAAVISGYRYDQNGDVKELYVHDDQIGPYSRVKPDGNFIHWKNEWTGEYGCALALVEKLIIPVYPKIRLTFDRIYKVYSKLKQGIPSEGFNTELYLTQMKEYKRFLIEKHIEEKEKILTDHLPRFLWYIHYNSTLSTHQLYINTNHTSKVCTSTLPYTELISM